MGNIPKIIGFSPRLFSPASANSIRNKRFQNLFCHLFVPVMIVNIRYPIAFAHLCSFLTGSTWKISTDYGNIELCCSSCCTAHTNYWLGEKSQRAGHSWTKANISSLLSPCSPRYFKASYSFLFTIKTRIPIKLANENRFEVRWFHPRHQTKDFFFIIIIIITIIDGCILPFVSEYIQFHSHYAFKHQKKEHTFFLLSLLRRQ